MMPIYEFYCHKCNTIFNFFSKTINTEKVPLCPRCKTENLQRQMSVFSTIKTGKNEVNNDEILSMDEDKMEKAIEMLAREAEKIDENDPRQTAEMMRKLSKAAGLSLSDGMEEALSRLEKGEDPDKIEDELGNLLENEEPFVADERRSKSTERPHPSVDETLYEL